MIQTQDIHYTISSSEILKGISMDFPKGSFVGIIGPNGSGKSTLLKCIYRTLKPSSGAVLLDGIPIESITTRQTARKLGVVMQHNFTSFEFTVKEVVQMGRSPYKRPLERLNEEDISIVRNSLKLVGMLPFLERSFSTLSGGEQQRVILARALAQQTPCLILDEPTNHLDIKYQLQIMDIVKDLDRTVISAFHDLNIAAMYCTKLYVMKSGRIVAQGIPEEVLTPQLIREVYEVDAHVHKDERGILRILFDP